MKIFRRILIILLVVLILIQFIRPARNISTRQSPNDISTIYTVPSNVSSILKKACNDCHSNNTRYPWYSYIQPVALWLDDHINEGKRGLNFNEFASYPLRRQYHKLEEVVDVIKKDEMPLYSYTIIHQEAKLSEEEKLSLTTWANALRGTMESKYPKDSLVRKK
jgi:hypothetical protein